MFGDDDSEDDDDEGNDIGDENDDDGDKNEDENEELFVLERPAQSVGGLGRFCRALPAAGFPPSLSWTAHVDQH